MFITILGMSIKAGIIAAVVLLLRPLLGKAPKFIRCILWALVAVRLVCPFSIESTASLLPGSQTLAHDITYSDPAAAESGISYIGGADEAVSSITVPAVSAEPFNLTKAATVVWLIGMASMLIYAAVSAVVLKKKVAASIEVERGVRICDDIKAPFILGIIKPCIYIPSSEGGQRLSVMTAHERAHISRGDHIWKPLGFALLAVYWFNPLMWISYIFFCRDIELACDEKVIKNMDIGGKKLYSEALLYCGSERRAVAACPLAFGETGIKQRVKSVLNYKKPAFWVIIAALAVCAAVSICFLTDPAKTELSGEEESYLHSVILERGKYDEAADIYPCEDHIILKTDRSGGKIKIWALVFYGEYSCKNGEIAEGSGWHVPAVITLDMSGNGYSSTYEEPRDGTYYAKDIKKLFPFHLRRKAINIHEYASEQSERCRKKAEKHFMLYDIPGMNIGADIPIILYADKRSVILCGTFGFIVFDTESGSVTNRCPAEKLKTDNVFDAQASEDGKRIYFHSNFNSFGSPYDYYWDIRSGKIKDAAKYTVPSYYRLEESLGTADELSEISESGLFGATAARCGKYVWYDTIDSTGLVSSLELIRYDADTKSRDVFKVFPETYRNESESHSIPFAAQYIRTAGYTGLDYPKSVVIRSRDELDAYIEKTSGVYDLASKMELDSVIGFPDVCDKYGSGFFEDNFLILIVSEEPSGSIRLNVESIVKNGLTGQLDISLERIIPETGTCDMAAWHVILELSKSGAVGDIDAQDPNILLTEISG